MHPSSKSNRYSLTLELSLQGSGLNFSTLSQFIGQLVPRELVVLELHGRKKACKHFERSQETIVKQFHAAGYNLEVIYDVDSLLQSSFFFEY